ncbi:MAG TPA: hypothetical protein VFU92_00850 [Usitatibacter sp.]|jgi:hypothetical protein|nr:hypothetical protein [Usitatibacter sp.]
MTPAARLTRQGLVHIWVAQLIQSLVLCGAVLLFLQMSGPLASTDAGPEWRRYAIYAVLLAGVPAMLYLRTFKGLLDADLAAERGRGMPDPELRGRLSHSLRIGGLLCDLPMAFGALQLFFGGETRWFVGATLVTIAIRLSYRPFDKGVR